MYLIAHGSKGNKNRCLDNFLWKSRWWIFWRNSCALHTFSRSRKKYWTTTTWSLTIGTDNIYHLYLLQLQLAAMWYGKNLSWCNDVFWYNSTHENIYVKPLYETSWKVQSQWNINWVKSVMHFLKYQSKVMIQSSKWSRVMVQTLRTSISLFQSLFGTTHCSN